MSCQEEQLWSKRAVTKLLPFFPGSMMRTNCDGAVTGIKLSGYGPGERALCISYLAYKHRLSVCGSWPSTPNRGQYTPQRNDQNLAGYDGITLSPDKTPAQVAADIKRRFLPAYNHAFDLCLVRLNADLNFASQQQATAAELGAILGTRVNGGHNGSTEYSVDLPRELFGEFRPQGSTVEVKIRSLTKAQALKLAEFIKSL